MNHTAVTSIENPDPLLTVAQASTYAGLSATFLYGRIELGALPVVRFGRAIRIRRSVLNTYLETGDEGR